MTAFRSPFVQILRFALRFTDVFLAVVVLGVSAPAFAGGSGSTVPEFFDVTPETTTPHSSADLYTLFTTGSGPYDKATMDGKIFPYPLPIGGKLGAPLYNGCYDRQSNRIGDLDSDNTCKTAITKHPGQSVYKLFLGYKIACLSGETSGNCADTQLSINCQYNQVQSGTTDPDRTVLSNKLCSTERGIVHRAKGSGENTPAFVGCYPGQNGADYPNCPACDPAFFNSHYDTNTYACSPCPGSKPIPAHAQNPSAIAWTSPGGAISDAQCTISSGLSCESGYHVSLDGQSCEPDAPSCSLGMTESQVDANSATSTDGTLTVTVTGATGSLSAFSIVSPSANPGSGTSLTKTFSNLKAGPYTVKAVDSGSGCSLSNVYTIGVAPAPSPTPSPSATPPATGCVHIANVVNPTTTTATDGKFDVHVDGMGAFTFHIVGVPVGYTDTTSYTIPSGSPMSGSVTFAHLPVGTYDISSTGTCVDDQSVSLASPVGPPGLPPCSSVSCSSGVPWYFLSSNPGSISGLSAYCAANPSVCSVNTPTSGQTQCSDSASCNTYYSYCVTGSPSLSSTSPTLQSCSMSVGTSPIYAQSSTSCPTSTGSCGPAPSPTPSGCNIATTTVGSPGYENGVLCQYGCGATTFTYPILSGTCSTGSNFAAARTQQGCATALDILSCGPTAGTPCSKVTCPGGRTLRIFHYSQEFTTYTANCANYGGCTTDDADQGTLCWTPMHYSSYYMICSSGAFADPGTAFWNNSSDSSMVLKKCSTDPNVPDGFWNDNAQSCGY